MEQKIRLPLEESELEELVEKAKDYALMHGICLRRRDAYERDALHFAPFMLLPTPFPRSEFKRVLEIQPLLNQLYFKVSHDHEFLQECLHTTIQTDMFTRRLFELHEKVRKEKDLTKSLFLGLFRSDAMLDNLCCQDQSKTILPCDVHSGSYACFKQIEFNTIASGFGWLGPASGLLHRYVTSEMKDGKEVLESLPENQALQGLCSAMINAWRLYGNPAAVILFLVEDVTYNICDQKFHEFEIRRQCPEVKVIRATLTEIGERAELRADKSLIFNGIEIGVIYLRVGYEPSQYPTETEWKARELMELSRAVVSPSVGMQLAGTKKVQQQLAMKGVLERFIKDQHQLNLVRSMFTGLYSLDKEEYGDAIIEAAISNPNRFVLKPQREGGGNNIYGEDIRPFLEKIRNSDERNAYILMDRIHPPVTKNYMVRPGQTHARLCEVISELGVFGYVIGRGDQIVQNFESGHMLRTKLSHVNEGGVSAGLGALDSVYLCDSEQCCPDKYPCLARPLIPNQEDNIQTKTKISIE